MATQQKRLLTAANSKLGKVDIVRLLEKDEAWAMLPAEARRDLYALLPEPREGEAARDPDVHPLRTSCRAYVQSELRRWQGDLKEGREGKKWREDAMRAGRDRVEGKFDEWKELQKAQDWGIAEDGKENAPVEVERLEKVEAVDLTEDDQ